MHKLACSQGLLRVVYARATIRDFIILKRICGLKGYSTVGINCDKTCYDVELPEVSSRTKSRAVKWSPHYQH